MSKEGYVTVPGAVLTTGFYTIPSGYKAEIKDGKVIVKEKESEDERIRKAIGAAICGAMAKSILEANGTNLPDALAYLEKQKEKEQKPAEWGPTKEQMVALNWAANGMLDNDSPSTGDIKASLRSLYDDLHSKSIRPAEWSEEDEKIIENIIDHLREYYVEKVGYPYVMEKDSVEIKEISLLRSIQAKHAQEWGEEEMKYINTCLLILNRPFHDMSDEERAAYNWLKSLRPQPKEEGCNYITPNKEFFQWIYDRLVHVHKENPDVDYMRSFKKRINNLSFEDKPHWKPSEEQMEALLNAEGYLREGDQFDSAKSIAELYEQLKAL